MTVTMSYSRSRNRDQSLEDTQDLAVRRILWHLISHIYVANDSGDASKTSASSRDDADVFVCILAGLSLAIGDIVQVRDGLK